MDTQWTGTWCFECKFSLICLTGMNRIHNKFNVVSGCLEAACGNRLVAIVDLGEIETVDRAMGIWVRGKGYVSGDWESREKDGWVPRCFLHVPLATSGYRFCPKHSTFYLDQFVHVD